MNDIPSTQVYDHVLTEVRDAMQTFAASARTSHLERVASGTGQVNNLLYREVLSVISWRVETAVTVGIHLGVLDISTI